MAYVANYLAEGASAISYGTETYPQALIALANVWGKSQSQCETLLNAQYGAANFATAAEALSDAGVVAAKNQYGYNCWALRSDLTYPVKTATSAVNSNTAISTTVEAAPVINTTVDSTTQTVTAAPATKSITVGGTTHNLKMFAGSAIQAISAAGLGISLGKTIDSTLYNLNPDFWDSVGMSTLNPETWGSITNGDDSFAANLFNTVFGIDTDTGYGQMYLDENAAAYLAYWMAQQGVFDIAGITGLVPADNPYGVQSFSIGSGLITLTSGRNKLYTDPIATWPNGYIAANPTAYPGPISGGNNGVYTKNGQTVYFSYTRTSYTIVDSPILNSSDCPLIDQNTAGLYAWVMLYGGYAHEGQTIEGIGTQDSATLPDVSSWDSPANTLTSLQSQYPDLWGNAFTNNVVQPDGSVLTKTYIPVATPTVDGMQDTQPTSTTQTQQNPEVEPSPIPSVDNGQLLQTIIKYITQTKPEQQTQTETDTTQPTYPDTGTGTTESPLLPTGNASALWSVYHPTQAQVNSFGAWLWSDDFLTNILKIMNDPMSGIITLHKVFATPVDSGSGTIVVGKLDSEVPSATVNQQYVTVDCGSVDLLEQFGNVFDYNPYTDVSLYLPFIGIVPLDTADVMRSTIHVVYGVDVYTGACLAQVEVSRDANTVNMYQYAGVCSVEYPLTGAQHSGLISGLLGIGTSVAGLVTGNAPMAIGGVAGGIASAAKRNQSRANSFSGNAGAMGIKKPYLIISRPQTKVAQTFPELQGFPTNASVTLNQCSGQVRVRAVHVEGINATESELREIESLLTSGVLV